MLFIGLLVGSTVYAGIKARKVRQTNKRLSFRTPLQINETKPPVSVDKGGEIVVPMDTQGDKNYPVATAALGLTLAGQLLFPPLLVLGVAGMVYLLWPTWKQAYNDITKKKRLFTRVTLDALVLPGALLTGHFLAVAFAFWFLYFALNNVAKSKKNATKNVIHVFAAPAEQPVYVLRQGVEIALTLKDIKVGETLVIGAGEIIPVDGIITKGHATIDQHRLTGESQPVEKESNDSVFAATLLLTGRIQVKVEKTGVETITNQTSKVLNDMISYTNNLELRGTNAADRMALPVFMLGSAASLFRGASGGLAVFWTPLDDALYATGPLSVLNFLNIALQRGILVKDGRALEVLRQVDTIVFDKTGTLTNDVPQVVKIHTCCSLSEADILCYAAAAEQKQVHPVALAILKAAATRAIELPKIQHAAYKTGYGLTVTIDEQVVRVGSYRFMQQLSLPLPEILQAIETESNEYGYSLIYVAIDEAIVGVIELHASLRSDTAETITKLHELGYQVCIISGDHEKPTQHLAKQLGIDRYFAETLPQDKANLIKTMQDEGRVVCYMGDGINDTMALKQADVSISLSGASTIATDTAQIILMHKKLSQLVDLLELSKRLDRTYKNIIWSSSIPSVGILGGVLLFHLSMSVAVIGYVTGMGLSITHAMLPLLQERRLSQLLPPEGASLQKLS